MMLGVWGLFQDKLNVILLVVIIVSWSEYAEVLTILGS